MPHLDIMTFVVQYSWTCITFLSFYMVLSVNYLPKIGKILHFRIKNITQNVVSTFVDKLVTPSVTTLLKRSTTQQLN